MEPDMTWTWQSLIIDARFIDLDCCYVYIRGKEMILFAKLGKPDAILSAKKAVHVRLRYCHAPPGTVIRFDK